MILILNTILMIAVFILVLCFCLEALKFSPFSRSTGIVISLCVALLCAISLFSFPVPVPSKDGMINVILLPYQAFGVFVILIVLVGLFYKMMGEQKREEIDQKIRKFFSSFGQ